MGLQAVWQWRWPWTMLCMVPLGGLGWLLSGVNLQLPVLDQWGLPEFFARVSAGTVGFADLFAHHGDTPHVMAVPRLLFAAVAFATDWNLDYERYLSLLLASVTVLLCWCIAIHDARRRGWELGVAMVTTSFLILATSAAWNWLWGFAAKIFFTNLCVVAGVAVLLPGGKGTWGVRLATGALCCMLATFSMAQGALSWIALLPSVVGLALTTRRCRTVMAVWSALAVVAWALYAWSLHASGYDPQIGKLSSRAEVLGPVKVAVYYFRLLGVPIASVVPGRFGHLILAPAVGLALICSFVVSTMHFLGRVSTRSAAIPWLSIGLFSILYAGLNSMGRAIADTVGFMPSYLRMQMYCTPAVLLSVAVVHLGWLAVAAEDGRRVRWARLPLAMVALAAVVSFPICVPSFRLVHQMLLAQQRWFAPCLELAPHWSPRAPCYPTVVAYGEKIRSLDELGFRSVRRELTFEAAPSYEAGSITAVEVERRPGGGRPAVVVRGDSTVPESTVVFTEVGGRAFFAHCHVDREGRWEVRYEKPQQASSAAEAWLYDGKSDRVRRLRGKVEY